jgi:hypothetical protein
LFSTPCLCNLHAKIPYTYYLLAFSLLYSAISDVKMWNLPDKV